MINPPKRIVCADIRNAKGDILLGARHWDIFMREQFKARNYLGKEYWKQGFIDNNYNFVTREEAWEIASATGQIIRRVGGDGDKLFSENLY